MQGMTAIYRKYSGISIKQKCPQERTVSEMERLTIKSGICDGHYILKCICSICADGNIDDEYNCLQYCEFRHHDCSYRDCKDCQIQKAFDCLAAYEGTGFTPEEVEALKADNDRLHQLIDELENSLRKEN